MSRRVSESPFTLFSFQDIITSVTGIILLLTLILTLELTMRKFGTAEGADLALVHSLEENIERVQAELAQLRPLVAEGTIAAERLASTSVVELQRQITLAGEQTLRAEAESQELQFELIRLQEVEKQTLATQFDRETDRKQLEELLRQAQEAREQVDEMRRTNSLIYSPDPGTGKVPWLVVLETNHIVATRAGSPGESREFSSTSPEGLVRQFLEFARSRSITREYFVLLVKPSGAAAFSDVLDELTSLGFEIGFDVIGEDSTPGFGPQHGK